MSERISTVFPTREEFEKALVIATEGREHHGLYATEDAEAILQPIAKYYWRHTILSLSPVVLATTVWGAANLPWYTPLIGVIGGVLITRAITLTPIAALFAPPGFTADDVARAKFPMTRST